MQAGVTELVLDPCSPDLRSALRDQVFARRAAVQSRVRSLGYPTITFPCRLSEDAALATAFAGVLVCRYGGIIVLDTVDPALWLPLCVLGQNIFTDPQRPMQVEEGIYPIGEPGPQSPVLITTNFSLTYFTVSGEVEASRVPSWLLVMNAEGQSVLTAWAAGKFVPEAIAPFVRRSGIEEKVCHRRLIIPGYVAQISGELAEELEGWEIVVGVREAVDIPRYMRSMMGAR
jgi:acetyl-CoA decarbonylase/synthase complex subunit gamma